MKNLIVCILFAVSLSASAGIVNKVQKCYDENDNAQNASFCADMAMARAIKKLQNQANQPQEIPTPTEFKVYNCSDANDPVLYQSIYGIDGQLLFQRKIKTVTQGVDEQEIIACRKEALELNQSLEFNPSKFRTACRCVGNDPVLQIILMDTSYTQIATINIGKFSEGLDLDELKNCEEATQTLPFCSLK